MWKLKKSVYGTADGGRLFYLRLRAESEKLGLKVLDGDQAVFYLFRDGTLHGMIGMHVDDLIFAGNTYFHRNITNEMEKLFRFTKMKINDFTFTGFRMKRLDNGDIQLDQEDYVKQFVVHDPPAGPGKRTLDKNELKEYREYIGRINWVAQVSDPTLTFSTHQYSVKVNDAKAEDLRKLRKLAIKMKENLRKITRRKLSDDPTSSDVKIQTYSDASHVKKDGVGNSINSIKGCFCNECQEWKIKSTGLED